MTFDYGRIWKVVVCGERGDTSEAIVIYERNKMAEYLLDMDVKGYFIQAWSFNSEFGAPWPVRVEVTFRFGNFCVHNIPDMLDQILGEDEEEQV